MAVGWTPTGRTSLGGKILQPRGDWRRLPPRRGAEPAVEEGGLAIAERRAIGAIDPTPGGEQDGVTGGGVPLAGRGLARVNIGPPFRDDTEFQA